MNPNGTNTWAAVTKTKASSEGPAEDACAPVPPRVYDGSIAIRGLGAMIFSVVWEVNYSLLLRAYGVNAWVCSWVGFWKGMGWLNRL